MRSATDDMNAPGETVFRPALVEVDYIGTVVPAMRQRCTVITSDGPMPDYCDRPASHLASGFPGHAVCWRHYDNVEARCSRGTTRLYERRPANAETALPDRWRMPTFVLRVGRNVFVGCRYDMPAETIGRVLAVTR